MARIRTIKPEFWSSPDTARLDDPWARLLFIAMWNWADDNGRGTANPKELAGFAFPNDDGISSADIRRMLGGIRRAFGVILYEVGGRPYYAIPSWELHQKIDRRSTGRYPTPEEGSNWDPDPPSASDLHERNGQVRSSENPAESPPRARSEPGAGSWNRGTGEQGKEPPRAAAENVSPDRARDDQHTHHAHPQREHPPLETVGPPQLDRGHVETAGKAVQGTIPTGIPTGVRRELVSIGAELLGDGTTADILTAALFKWRNKPGASPKLLPHLVSDVLRERAAAKTPPKSTTADRQKPCFNRLALYEEATANGYTSTADQIAYVSAREHGSEPPPHSGLAPVIELPPGRTA
jgi:hypothetical protein